MTEKYQLIWPSEVPRDRGAKRTGPGQRQGPGSGEWGNSLSRSPGPLHRRRLFA